MIGLAAKSGGITRRRGRTWVDSCGLLCDWHRVECTADGCSEATLDTRGRKGLGSVSGANQWGRSPAFTRWSVIAGRDGHAP